MVNGGCLCGAVRWRSGGPPSAVRQCWCRVCQAIAAGNATVNAVFTAADVAIEGQTTAFVGQADSGSTMTRRFCPACGVHLFSQSDTRPHLIVIRVGTFDEPREAAPQSVIWAASAPPWARIPDDLPSTPGQPPPVP